LVPKDHPQIAELQAAVKEVGQEAHGAKWSKAQMCLKDGDQIEYDGYAGNWSIKAGTKKRPVLLNRDKSAVSEEDGVLYAGCYVNASISLYAFTNNYGSFISAQLNAVQFARDGEPFGDGSDSGYSDDDFDYIDDDDGFKPFVGAEDDAPF